MPTRTLSLVAAAMLACAGALAAEEPESVYRKAHAAAVAGNLEELRQYTAEAQRAGMALPEVPKRYRLTGKAVRRDGDAVELRAAATADSVGLGYTQIFGVVGLVREKGEWKIERLSWSPERPGEYPEGYVLVEGPAPEPRPSTEEQLPRFKPPPSRYEPSHLVTPKRDTEAKPGEQVLEIERPPRPCVIKPVMTDDELRACGAAVPDSGQ